MNKYGGRHGKNYEQNEAKKSEVNIFAEQNEATF